MLGIPGEVEDYPNFTEKIYSVEAIDTKTEEGYIPISSPDDINNLRNGRNQTFAVGTKWEKHIHQA